MKLQFWGAAKTVTGSMHLIEANGYRLLLDCGLFQGRRQEARDRNEQFPFNPASIDAVVLSHAHIDHSGNLPTLTKQGFENSIYATSATRDLCSAMLRDSANIQESDAAFVNKRNAEKGLPPIKPLYTVPDALETLKLFRTVEYEQTTEILPNIYLVYRDAGHILGSATVTLVVMEKGRTIFLAFTGDVGRKGAAVVRDPDVLPSAEILITESTYGGRHHGPLIDARQKLVQVVGETVARRGSVIIPAFAVGRTQDIVYHLHDLFQEQALPPVPVYVDSPLATNVTEIFRMHPECYDEEIRARMSNGNYADPFGFARLTYIRDVEVSKKLNESRDPAIIISPSGMCEAGRVLHHLRHHVGDPRATVLFVGFQAENTLGRRLSEGAETVRVFGEEFDVRAQIERIDGYSAHADEQEMLDFIGAVPKPPRRVFVVHGEPDATRTFAAALRLRGIDNVTVPERGQIFDI